MILQPLRLQNFGRLLAAVAKEWEQSIWAKSHVQWTLEFQNSIFSSPIPFSFGKTARDLILSVKAPSSILKYPGLGTFSKLKHWTSTDASTFLFAILGKQLPCQKVAYVWIGEIWHIFLDFVL